MNKLTNFLIPLGLVLIGCGGNNNNGKMDAPPQIDAPPADAPNTPPNPPALGMQIDRMGRPAINTALNHAFDVDAMTKGAAKDNYNKDEGAGNWPAMYGGDFATSLGIIDGLDGSCGNQVLYDGSGSGVLAYASTAGLLADDELYVNSHNGTCALYLGVELTYLGIAGANDCGGRTLSDDVIDVSYSALAAGLAQGFNPATLAPLIGDGVAAHTDTSTTFPFLGTPH